MFTSTSALLALSAAWFGLGLAPAAQVTPSDETAKGYAFIEVRGPERAPFVGEPFTLRLRAGVDVDVLETNLVQLFRQALDVPVQLDHPWFEGAPEHLTARGPTRAVVEEAPLEGGSAVARVALGGELIQAGRMLERGPSGQRFTVVEFERDFVATSAGAYTIPEARLGFAYAVEFRDDLVAGRVPIDRRDAFVHSPAAPLTVRALPESGQPFSFTGAIGTYALDARLSRSDLSVGEEATLEVVVTAVGAAGALGAFELPRVPEVRGARFGARHTVDGPTSRTLSVQLVGVTAGATSVGPIDFAYFDPGAGRYVELSSPALPLRVQGGDAGAGAGPGMAPVEGRTEALLSEEPSSLSLQSVLGVATLVVLGAVFVLVWRRDH
ncbi:MAG: hypothetical protein R3F49_06275 [Planctomycetota bacterium]